MAPSALGLHHVTPFPQIVSFRQRTPVYYHEPRCRRQLILNLNFTRVRTVAEKTESIGEPARVSGRHVAETLPGLAVVCHGRQ